MFFQNSLEHVSPKVREYYNRKVNPPGIAAKEQDDTGPILHALKLIDPRLHRRIEEQIIDKVHMHADRQFSVKIIVHLYAPENRFPAN